MAEKIFKGRVFLHGEKYYEVKRWINLKISPLNNKLLFATGDVLGGWGTQFLKSSDGGTTWEDIEPTKNNVNFLPGKEIFLGDSSDLIFDTNDQNTFYVIGVFSPGGFSRPYGGFLKTTDGGHTYAFLQINGMNMEVYKINPTSNPLKLYVTTPQGVYKTDDGGKNWRPINIGLPSGHRSDVLGTVNSWLSVDPVNYIIYHTIVWHDHNEYEAVIYKSEDGGVTWHEYYNFQPKTDPPWGNPIYTFGQRLYLLERDFVGQGLSLQGESENFVILIKIKEFNSSEWKTIKTPASKVPAFLFNFKSNPQKLYLIDREALYISEDEGFSWRSIPFSIGVRMADMEINKQSQPIIYLLGRPLAGHPFVYIDDSWWNYKVLYKSVDEGRNWIEVSPSMVKWFDQKTKTSKEIDLRFKITTFTMDHASPDTVFLGTKGYGIYRTINGGKTWEFISEGLVKGNDNPEPLSIDTIAIDPKNPNIVYAGTNRGVFRSLNKGTTWELFNNGLPRYVEVIGDYIGEPCYFYSKDFDFTDTITDIKINNSTPQLIVFITRGRDIWRLMDSLSWNFMKGK